MKTNAVLKDPVSLLPGVAIRKFSKARAIAARYGLCPKTIFRLADKGQIHRFKLNERVVLFDDNEVAALFEAARIPITVPMSQFKGLARTQMGNGGKGGKAK
jgi:hypothetical protein